jgi:hypothetical protein
MRKVLTYIWVLPTSLVGLCFLPDALTSGEARWVDGVLELHGRMTRFLLSHIPLSGGGVSAMTLGHVVIGQDAKLLEETRDHERVHVRQCERWGPLFIPAYLFMAVVMKCRGKRAYMDNPFEREAYEEAG